VRAFGHGNLAGIIPILDKTRQRQPLAQYFSGIQMRQTQLRGALISEAG